MRRSQPSVLDEPELVESTDLTPGRSSRREALRTEFDFQLPRGYLDADGVVHRSGTMRLATARDELLPLYDSRVQENPAFTTVVLSSIISMKSSSRLASQAATRAALS